MLRGRSSSRMGSWMFFVMLTAAPALAGAASIELISGTATVSDSFGTSEQPALSADGRYVAFVSDAANLVPGQEDGNNARDVFLHDRVLGTTALVSHVPGSPTRAAGPGQYNFLEISADGRYVAFSSSAADLAPGAGANGSDLDVFLWDRLTGTTTLVSHAAGASGAAADGATFAVRMSADGNFLALLSNAKNLVAGQSESPLNPRTADVFLWSRASDTMTLLSRQAGTMATAANQLSSAIAISDDGGAVVFATAATDLLPNVTVVDGTSQVYAYDRAAGTLTLVSRAATGANHAAGARHDSIAVSGAGRYVAFASESANLVPGQVDTEGFSSLDAFLYDRETGEMRLVSHGIASPLVAAGISSAGGLSMSAGGRYVAFASSATDLVPGQVDPHASHLSTDVFIWDRNTGLTALASHSRDSATTAGSPGPNDLSGTSGSPQLSADGRFLVFHSTAVDLVHGQTEATGTVDVFLYDQTTRGVTLLSRTPGSAPGNGLSFTPVLSADGGVAAFVSEATDLGEGQADPYRFRDLFLYVRASGEITSPSRRDPGLPAPLTAREESLLAGLSADGRLVAFERDASYLRDTGAGTATRLSAPLSPGLTREISVQPVLSADGRFAAVLSVQSAPGYAEGLFLYDLAAGTYTLVNHAPGSAQGIDGLPSLPALSADGRYLAYQCTSCGLVPGHPGPPSGHGFDEIFLYDRLTGLNTLVSHAASSPAARADGRSYSPAISADGRYTAFWSTATNLFPGQIDASGTFDLFVFDRETGGIELATHAPGSPATAAGLPNASFIEPAHLSADGRFLAFRSNLPNLVPGQVDPLDSFDVFLRDRTAGTTALVTHAASSAATAANGQGFSSSHEVPFSMSADGRFVVFESLATDLVAGTEDTNGAFDVFLYDRATGTNSLVSHAAGAPLEAGNGASEVPRISADGGTIAFLSGATDLATGQAVTHAFERSRSLYAQYLDQSGSTGTTALLAEALKLGRPFNLFPTEEAPIDLAPQLSADGRRIAFTSDSAHVLGDYNRTWDVYLWDGTAAEPEDPEDPEGPVAVPPCRLLDTRRRAERPVLTSNVQRTVTARGRCGVPDTAKQVVVKVTVFNPSGKGNLRFYAGDVTAPPSAILRFERRTGRTETFTLPLSPNGTLTILPFVAGRGTVHGAVEVNAYSE